MLGFEFDNIFSKDYHNVMIQIAIDGHSGSGKGELSKGLAQKLNLKHLDTGAILRAIGLYFYDLEITSPSQEDILEHLENLNVKVQFEENIQKTYLNGTDVSTTIRTEQIGQMASRVAVFKETMQKLIDISQDFAEHYDCVLDGRNITSEVLPNADVKIFLDAKPEIRAKRRFVEMQKKNPNITFDEVMSSLVERDYRDTHREFSRMVIVPDAMVIDNSNMTIEETIEYCSENIKKILKNKGKI